MYDSTFLGSSQTDAGHPTCNRRSASGQSAGIKRLQHRSLLDEIAVF